MKGEEVREEQEIRIDLPVKAFVPIGWLEQEALRLELYRRIATAPDHRRLAEVRAEAEDRYGALPPQVETLFSVGSLRITCARLSVGEVSTYRDEVRIKPLQLPEALAVDLSERVPEATYHATTATLNLRPERVASADLPGWVEERLLAALEEEGRDGGQPVDREGDHRIGAPVQRATG
jgi:transcription-repair coupling factor (superfamily II helicase)